MWPTLVYRCSPSPEVTLRRNVRDVRRIPIEGEFLAHPRLVYKQRIYRFGGNVSSTVAMWNWSSACAFRSAASTAAGESACANRNPR